MACENIDDVKKLLVEAQQAYHDLLTGNKARVVVDQNGERVEFVATNRANLYQYVQSLQKQVDDCLATETPKVGGPLRFFF